MRPADAATSADCIGEMRGQLLPYAIYVPSGPAPAGGFGLTLLLHSLSANYNQFAGSHNQSQFANRGTGSIVITPSGRGPDGWYYDHARRGHLRSVGRRGRALPARSRLHRHRRLLDGRLRHLQVHLASSRTCLRGPSRRWGRRVSGVWVPPAEPQPGGNQSLTERQLASVRNVPFLIWDETTDELVPIAGVLEQVAKFDALGYRYEFDQFLAGEHLTLALNDEYRACSRVPGRPKPSRPTRRT